MIRKNLHPWHRWIVALVMIFIYTNGLFDFFMMLTHNISYYESKGYGEAVYGYFTDYPLVPLLFWALNITTGFLAGFFLLFHLSWAKKLALISALSMALLQLITFGFMDRWNILGTYISIFDLFLLLLTFSFYGYCRWQEKLIANRE